MSDDRVREIRDRLERVPSDMLDMQDAIGPDSVLVYNGRMFQGSDAVQLRLAADLRFLLAELERARKVVEAARELASWDWLGLLIDHHDSDTVLEDVERIDLALAEYDAARSPELAGGTAGVDACEAT